MPLQLQTVYYSSFSVQYGLQVAYLLETAKLTHPYRITFPRHPGKKGASTRWERGRTCGRKSGQNHASLTESRGSARVSVGSGREAPISQLVSEGGETGQDLHNGGGRSIASSTESREPASGLTVSVRTVCFVVGIRNGGATRTSSLIMPQCRALPCDAI